MDNDSLNISDNLPAPQKPGDLFKHIKKLLQGHQKKKNDKSDHQVWEEIKKYTQQLQYSTSDSEDRYLYDLITKTIRIDKDNQTTNIATNARDEYVKICLIGTGLIAASAIGFTAAALCVPNMIATLGRGCTGSVLVSSGLCSYAGCIRGCGCIGEHALPIRDNSVDFQNTISLLTTQFEEKKKDNKRWNIEQADTFLKKCRKLQNNLSYLAQNITLSPSSAIEVLSYMIQIRDLLKQVAEQEKLPLSAIGTNYYNKSIKDNNNYTSSNNLYNGNNQNQNISNNNQ